MPHILDSDLLLLVSTSVDGRDIKESRKRNPRALDLHGQAPRYSVGIPPVRDRSVVEGLLTTYKNIFHKAQLPTGCDVPSS